MGASKCWFESSHPDLVLVFEIWVFIYKYMKTNSKSYKNINKANQKNHSCLYCNKLFSSGNIKKHQLACIKNPKNLKQCPVCNKNHHKNGITCSYSCSNTFFRSGKNNPNWKKDKVNNYREICFKKHGKQCIVCQEKKIVAVHHINEDHSDNRPENLVPLCPTHHQYVHSKYRSEIVPLIENYIKNFKDALS